MKRHRLSWVLALPAGLLLAGAGQGAFDGYLQISGIAGEATDPAHPGWIEVSGLTNRLAATAVAGLGSVSELCVVKAVDKSSPLLMQHAGLGTVLPNARLELVTATSNRVGFYTLELSNVMVQSVQSGGSANAPGTRLGEVVWLSYQRVNWTYTQIHAASGLPQLQQGSYWDLLAGAGANPSQVVVYKIANIRAEPHVAVLSWPSGGARACRVYGSTRIDGRFSLLAELPAAGDQSMSFAMPMGPPSMFFVVEEKR